MLEPEKPRQSARCLVVDDDRDFLESIRDFLRDALPTVLTETQPSVAEALRQMDRSKYDIVIADLRMHPTDGITFLKECRRLHPETKRVLLTAYVEPVVQQLDDLYAIADLVLLKPVETRPFVDHLRVLLGTRIWGR